MDSEILPEEKLLRVIRNAKHKKSGEVLSKKERPGRGRRGKTTIFFVTMLNYVLAISTAAFFIYFVYDLLTENQDFFYGEFEAQPEIQADPPVDFLQHPKLFSDYETQFKRRDLFEQPQDSVVADATGAEVMKNFRLVGIVLGEQSKAIVEDMQAKRTLFVREGDRLGEMKILHIREGKIILSYRDEELELLQ